MQKLNLFKKNKLWLASLSITTMSSLVLAACGATDLTSQNNNTNNNSEQSHSNNSEDANSNQTAPKPNPDSNHNEANQNSNNDQTGSKPNHLIIPQATKNQLATAKILLQTPEIKTVLNNNKKAASATITANLLTLNKIGTFSQDTVKDAKTALGISTNPSIDEVDQTKVEAASVMSLIHTLEAQLKTAENDSNIVPNDKKDQFGTAVNKVKIQASNLLTKLNALPTKLSENANFLNNAREAFEAALTTYKAADTTTLSTAWVGLKKAHANYQTQLNEITPKLISAQKSGFELDQATSELEKYINTNVATFLSNTNNGTKHSLVLNTLVTKVRTSVLGTIGYDLWPEGNAPAGIPTGNNKKSSTQLYAIVVGLAHQTAAWNNLNQAMKILTFNQSLILEAVSAVNVFALHIDATVPLDVARLNAYLVVDGANAVKILTDNETNNSIAKTLTTIAKGIDHFDTLLAETGTNSLIHKLSDLESKVSDGNRKKKVTDLKTATQKLQTKFATFKDEWNKLQPLLWTTTGTTTTYPLLDAANKLNQLIGLANHYSDVLQVVGQAQSLQTLVNQITIAVNIIPSNQLDNPQETTLATILDEIVADNNSIIDNSFGKALDDFATESGWTDENKTAAEALAKSMTSSDSKTIRTGLIYTDLVGGATQNSANDESSKKLTFENLSYNLSNLENETDKKLHDLLELLNKQLQPSDGSQTSRLNNHLAAIFNNGNVLPESEVHN
ncbi:hypothetical protein J2Z62_000411 [Mycoplasmoides fastidiosum]|uniref:Lipoprotein n=1 Tax=Mycoplasmoides fastidiosum TaxID=92758 RepID=A0ABU0LZE5_9BACT|nr:hypothetical protein [Mycoplasmoides fastidiosum]MDQ0513973.1 hypothetical protein [Mycoplasmoides fastidiosum]UUD37613.1 hypothetical protein NPA10_03535 [Mycoplasmoides fastidiosum]